MTEPAQPPCNGTCYRHDPPTPSPWSRTHMYVCHLCGNKRCPATNDCANKCTRSNATGQPGSYYP